MELIVSVLPKITENVQFSLTGEHQLSDFLPPVWMAVPQTTSLSGRQNVSVVKQSAFAIVPIVSFPCPNCSKANFAVEMLKLSSLVVNHANSIYPGLVSIYLLCFPELGPGDRFLLGRVYVYRR